MATYFSNDLLPERAFEYMNPQGRTWPQLPFPERSLVGEGYIWVQNEEEIRRPHLGTRTRKEDLQGGAGASICECVARPEGSYRGPGYTQPHLLETPRHVAPPVWDLLLHLLKLSLSPRLCCLLQNP